MEYGHKFETIEIEKSISSIPKSKSGLLHRQFGCYNTVTLRRAANRRPSKLSLTFLHIGALRRPFMEVYIMKNNMMKTLIEGLAQYGEYLNRINR